MIGKTTPSMDTGLSAHTFPRARLNSDGEFAIWESVGDLRSMWATLTIPCIKRSPFHFQWTSDPRTSIRQQLLSKMFPTTLLTTLLLALSVAANPVLVDRSPVTLPISRRLNLTSVHNLLRHDQTRAKALKAKGAAKSAGLSFNNDAVINEQVDNQAVTYVASVGVGSPATTCMSSIFHERWKSLTVPLQ